jgi:hypothetical protein
MKPVNQLETFMYEKVAALMTPFEEHQKPLWGTMNATQMLEHLSIALKASNGLLTAPLTSDLERAAKLKRIALLSDRPLMKDFNNPVLALVPKSDEVITHEAAKERLKENIDLFRKAFQSRDDSHTHIHNMFGPLTYHEWLWFHYKHVHHHFAQFAIIPYVEKFELQ